MFEIDDGSSKQPPASVDGASLALIGEVTSRRGAVLASPSDWSIINESAPAARIASSLVCIWYVVCMLTILAAWAASIFKCYCSNWTPVSQCPDSTLLSLCWLFYYYVL